MCTEPFVNQPEREEGKLPFFWFSLSDIFLISNRFRKFGSKNGAVHCYLILSYLSLGVRTVKKKKILIDSLASIEIRNQSLTDHFERTLTLFNFHDRSNLN